MARKLVLATVSWPCNLVLIHMVCPARGNGRGWSPPCRKARAVDGGGSDRWEEVGPWQAVASSG